MKKHLVILATALFATSALAADVQTCKSGVAGLYADRLVEAMERMGPPPFNPTEEEAREYDRKVQASIPYYTALKDAGFKICEGLASKPEEK